MSHHSSPLPLFRSIRRLRTAFWQRRVAQWLVRATWLALLVPTIFMAGYLWLGWQVGFYDWLVPMLVVGLLSLFWSMRPINLGKMVHRLDNHLKLRARLVTAFEASQTPEAYEEAGNSVVQRLLQEAVNLTVGMRRRVNVFSRGFWLEMQALIAVAALLSALLMLDAFIPRTPDALPVELPSAGQEPEAEDVIPPDPQLSEPPIQQTQASGGEQLQRALQILADALRDQAVTRSVSEAIDRGDLGEAANDLRRVADQLEALSEETRAQLGDSLQEAADKIGSDAPSLTEPLQAGSDSFDRNDLRGAGQSLEDVAEVLESIEDSPQESAEAESDEGGSGESEQGEGESQEQESESQEEPGQPDPQGEENGQGGGDGAGDSDNPDPPPTEEERLAMEGQPLELESDPDELEDRVLQPAELEAEAGDKQTQDSPFARQPLNATNTELGPDPLTYPWEKRDVIRRYFTP